MTKISTISLPADIVSIAIIPLSRVREMIGVMDIRTTITVCRRHGINVQIVEPHVRGISVEDYIKLAGRLNRMAA